MIHYTDGVNFYRRTTDYTINHKNELVDLNVNELKKISKDKFQAERNKWFRDHNYEWKYKGELYRTNDEPIEFIPYEKLIKNPNVSLDFKIDSWMPYGALVIHNGKLYLAFNLTWQDRITLINKEGKIVKSTSLKNCKNYHKVR